MCVLASASIGCMNTCGGEGSSWGGRGVMYARRGYLSLLRRYQAKLADGVRQALGMSLEMLGRNLAVRKNGLRSSDFGCG